MWKQKQNDIVITDTILQMISFLGGPRDHKSISEFSVRRESNLQPPPSPWSLTLRVSYTKQRWDKKAGN